MSKAEDLLLISRVVISDDRSAFDRLVRKYQSSLRRFLLNLTSGNDALADDLAQETFIKAYLNIRSFRGISAFPTWLFRIAYNQFYDAKRAEKPTEEMKSDQIDQSFRESSGFSSENYDIYTAMQVLNENERAAILLCYMEEMTHKEAAAIMDLPLGTVKTNISNAKIKLANFLKNEGYGKE